MAKKERTGYFYEEQENAVREYLNTDNEAERNRIFNTILHPAFTKMIESIIRRYNLNIPNEEFEETFDDTMSFLMMKINHFDPQKKFKAYSYCGTLCKNYLLHRRIEYGKELDRSSSYDTMCDEINNDYRYSTNNIIKDDFVENTMKQTAEAIKMIMSDETRYTLNEKEIKVGNALVSLLENWEDELSTNGSNKLNKSIVLYFLRENTKLTTKEVRESMKKYKKAYYRIKEELMKEN
jgi:hypothetical protein